MDTLLSVEQAAERLGTSVRFVRRLIAERRITYVKVGRKVLFERSAVTAYIDAHRVQPLTRAQLRDELRRAA